MGARATDAEKARFHAWRAKGLTVEEAAARVNKSKSWGEKEVVKFNAARRGMVAEAAATPQSIHADEISPKTYEELSKRAQRGWNDFSFFRRTYLGSVPVLWQERAAGQMLELWEDERDVYAVVNIPQGAGKTRFFSHDFPAWMTVRDRTLRGSLGSHSRFISDGLVENLRNTFLRTTPVRARRRDLVKGLALDAEATLVEDYGFFKPGSSEAKWQREQFTVAQIGGVTTAEKEDTWTALSFEAKFLGVRLDLAIWDDLVTKKMLRSETVMQHLFDWWDTEAESRLEPGGLLLQVAQRLGANDQSRHCLDKIDPEWEADLPDDAEVLNIDLTEAPRQYVHIKFKAHYEDFCEGNHDKTAPPHDGETPGACLLDPPRITWQKIKVKKAAGNFEVLYQQEDVDPESVLIRRSWIYGGLDRFDDVTYPGCLDQERAINELPEGDMSASVRYVTIDPSPTKWWSIQDWLYVPGRLDGGAYDPNLSGLRYLINHHRVRLPANEVLDWINSEQKFGGLLHEVVENARSQGRPIQYVIIEKNAAQRWFMQFDHFRRWQIESKVMVIQHETHANKADPDMGVETLMPQVYRAGLARLPWRGVMSKSAVLPLVTELTQYPNGQTDDCVMSNWLGEFRLPTMYIGPKTGGKVNKDMPSWMRRGKGSESKLRYPHQRGT